MRNVYDLAKLDDQRHVGTLLSGVVQGFDEKGEPYGTGLEALDAVVLHLHQQAAHAAMARSRASWWERLRGRAVTEPSAADLARMEGYLAGLYDVRQALVAYALIAATPPAEEPSPPARGFRHAGIGTSGVRP